MHGACIRLCGEVADVLAHVHRVDRRLCTGSQQHGSRDRRNLGQLGDRRIRHLDAIEHRCRSEEHTSELQSLMRISYAVFCLKKKNIKKTIKPETKNTQDY